MILTELTITEYLVDKYADQAYGQSEKQLINLALPLTRKAKTLEEKLWLVKQIVDKIDWTIVKELIDSIESEDLLNQM